MNHRSTLFVSLALACLLASCGKSNPGPAYDITFDYSPKVGDKYDWKRDNNQSIQTSFSLNGENMGDESTSAVLQFAGDSEVISVANGEVTELEFTIKEATVTDNGVARTLGFIGKAIRVEQNAEGKSDYRYADGSAIAHHDVEVIKTIRDLNRNEDGQTESELLAPPGPVKVGESWTPNLDDFLKSMGDTEQFSFDTSNSTGEMTLQSVEEKDGAEYATLQGKFTFGLVIAAGPFELESSIPTELDLTLIMCLDPNRFDVSIEATVNVDGSTEFSQPGAPGQLLVKMSGTMSDFEHQKQK